MEWRDTGLLLSVRPHGETSVIADVFTAEHGRHAGVIRGGISRKMKPMLQPGAQLSLTWTARLETHLGSFRAELEKSRAVDLMRGRLCLEAANAIFSLLSVCLPERENMPYLYARTCALLDHIEPETVWLADYVRWEAMLLNELGFGLDLTRCASTGTVEDLIYVSPKSGRAVSRTAGLPYADRMLKLPAFLRDTSATVDPRAIRHGLEMTAYFLETGVLASLGKQHLPVSRGRLADLVQRMQN